MKQRVREATFNLVGTRVSGSHVIDLFAGTGALTWEDVDGELSGTGLTLSSSGLVSGTPTSAGSISFTARVTDEALATDTHVFGFDVNGPVAISAVTVTSHPRTVVTPPPACGPRSASAGPVPGPPAPGGPGP